MRLIDADALLEELPVHPDGGMRSVKDECLMIRVRQTVRNAPTIGGWISVKDRMPAETHSIFRRLIESEKWTNAMWREQSGKVLVTVSLKDGTRYVTTGETHDGVWNTTISRTLEHEVTHWMPFPEPPKED